MNCCMVLGFPSGEYRRVLCEIVFEMVEEEDVLEDFKHHT